MTPAGGPSSQPSFCDRPHPRACAAQALFVHSTFVPHRVEASACSSSIQGHLLLGYTPTSNLYRGISNRIGSTHIPIAAPSINGPIHQCSQYSPLRYSLGPFLHLTYIIGIHTAVPNLLNRSPASTYPLSTRFRPIHRSAFGF